MNYQTKKINLSLLTEKSFSITIILILVILLFFINFYYQSIYKPLSCEINPSDLNNNTSQNVIKKNDLQEIITNLKSKTIDNNNYTDIKSPFTPIAPIPFTEKKI